MTYWLSYGGGVNSTALAILLCEGKLPQYAPWRIVFADTMDEQDETYAYIDSVFVPYLRRHGRTLEVVRGHEGVIERWERLKVTGSRTNVACRDHSKLKPCEAHVVAHGGPDDVWLLGIDAGESHRSSGGISQYDRATVRPLVDLDIDREGCAKIIEAAGLPIPLKSGCWHCPFMRVRGILDMAAAHPERMQRIIRLEIVANETHRTEANPIHQWNRTPAIEYAKRACEAKSSGPLFQDVEPDAPCACYDG